MSASQSELVISARALAEELATGTPPVKRNIWQSLVANFQLDRDLPRFRRLVAAVEQDDKLRARGRGYGEQLDQVVAILDRLLTEGRHSADELRTLFGWVARLLQIKSDFRGPRRPEPNRPTPPRQPPPKPAFGGLGGKNQAALEALRKKFPGGGS